MKRGVIAIILFMLLGAATSVGVAWWLTLRDHKWGVVSPPPVDCNGWITETWTDTGVRFAAAGGDAFIAGRMTRPAQKVEPEDGLGWSSLLQQPADEYTWFNEQVAGWPFLCVRQAVVSENSNSFCPIQLPRPGDVKEVLPFPYLGAGVEGAMIGKNPIEGLRLAELRMLPVQPIWTGLLLNAALFGLAWFVVLRPIRLVKWLIAASRRRRGRCPACAYDRRAVESDACSECGASRSFCPVLLSTLFMWCASILAAAIVVWGILFVMLFTDSPPYASIHRAALEGDVERIRSELRGGVDVDQRCERTTEIASLTALAIASTLRHDDAVRVLIDAGADVNATDHIQQTPLHLACGTNDNSSVVRRLIEAGADVDRVDALGKTPLVWACIFGDLATIDRLIDGGVNLKDPAPIHMAVQCDRMDVLHRLLERGATIDRRLLDVAILQRTTDLLEALLSHGADVHAAGEDGANALFNVSSNPEAAGVWALLVEEGVDVRRADNSGRTPLHEAVASGTPEFVAFVLKHGADPTITNDDGETPLHLANPLAREDYAAIVELLIAHGADVNARDGSGDTKLRKSLFGGEMVVSILIEHGADPTIRNHRGESAMSWAESFLVRTDPVVVEILRQAATRFQPPE